MNVCAPSTGTCRSPVSQGVFEKIVRREGLQDRVEADSAGTGDRFAGEPPDRRGVGIGGQRARRIRPEDCALFDHVLTMDTDNYRNVSGLCGGGAGGLA